jgi:undecaprenyl-diphosphatase
MITVIQAIILGAIQGITELFPISSLGHTVILPSLFGWHNLNQSNQYFLTYIVATHFATALVLFFFFKKEWMKIIGGIFRSLKEREVKKDDIYAKFGWLLVIGTIPVGILGLLFQDSLAKLFASAQIASVFLIINGVILYGAELLRKKRQNKIETLKESDKNISKLSWKQSFGIGLFQSAALLPGISRSGTSMAGGLLSGLDNEDAARFSFMLATPVIGVAAILKLPELLNHSAAGIRGAMLAGAIAAGIAAYISVKYLVKYFQTKTLTPFAIYCFVAGIIYSIYFLKH